VPVLKLKTYQDVYGTTPLINKTCTSCAKRHALYLESHNTANKSPTTSTASPTTTGTNDELKSKANKIVTPITDIPPSVAGVGNRVRTEAGNQKKTVTNPVISLEKAPKLVQPATMQIRNKPQVKPQVADPRVVDNNVKDIVVMRNNVVNTQSNVVNTQSNVVNTDTVAVRKRVVALIPKAKKAVGVRRDKRKIIFQSSRIIRYNQERVPASSKN
jgi:hypothetical protein